MSRLSEGFAGAATATTRVVESYCPPDRRLFDDPFALRFLPWGWQVLLRLLFLPGLRSVVLSLRERRMPGTLGAILCRTRYIDDILKRSLADGVEQVVILGAGFDSRAYRIDGMDQVVVFEVDLPGALELKQARVQRVLGAIPGHVIFVGIDFDCQALAEVLSAAGFDTGKKTLFIWEGVTQYLTAEAVNDTLQFVSTALSDGSGIVFTYIRRELVDGTDRPDWFNGFVSLASRVGSPLKFGLPPGELDHFLSERCLKLVSDVGAADFQALYLTPLRRDLNVFDGERIALAEAVGVPVKQHAYPAL